MKAMVLERTGSPLRPREIPAPAPGPGQVQIDVSACAICRTDLHVVDGDLPDPKLPLILGHEIVGRVASVGPGVSELGIGQRIGVPWLGWTCGRCRYCSEGRENLCEEARFTGYHIDGGYAERALADHRYCFPIPDEYDDVEAAPLLCAGLIGFRSLRIADAGGTSDGPAAGVPPRRVGLYGFGAAAHIVTQIAVHEGREIYAFTRPGDTAAQSFARRLGAVWAGGSDEPPPRILDAAILYAPVGALIPPALQAVARGGIVVCAGIHMSDIPAFPYRILWQERILRSVANLTRGDARAFLEIASRFPVKTETHVFRLEEANEALAALREGRLQGAAVLDLRGRP